MLLNRNNGYFCYVKVLPILFLLVFSFACRSREPGNAAYSSKRRPSEVRARSDKKIRSSQEKVYYRESQKTIRNSKKGNDFQKSKYRFKRVRNKEKKSK
jgi:hypothetical protein